MLAGGYLTSNSCGNFLGVDTSNLWSRSIYFSQLTAAVTRQVAYDGAQTNISMYAAGMSDGKNPNDVKMKKTIPVCSLFVPFHGPYGVARPTGLATAASQVVVLPPASGPAINVYINTDPRALAGLTQATVLHESLHNLTGLSDFIGLDWRNLYPYRAPWDLKTFVGIEPEQAPLAGIDPNPGTTNDISIQLRAKGCAGVN